MQQMLSAARYALVAIALASLVACATIRENHGYVPEPDVLDRVSVGIDTRDSVEQIAGRPSSAGVLDSSGWYYVQSRWERRGAREAVEVDRRVVAITFDSAGLVENIAQFGINDGQVVVLSRRVTESDIRGITFLQQIFGNFGALDPTVFAQGL